MKTPIEIIADAYSEFNPVRVFALFSGGHDSLCSTSIASTFRHFDGVIHIDTGIGLKETRCFVEETCSKRGWKLFVVGPQCGTYEKIVKRTGFPGPATHGVIYRQLKDTPLRAFARSFIGASDDTVLLVSGIRRSESRKRKDKAQAVKKDGQIVWCSPIIEWSTRDCQEWILDRGLDANPVVQLLHKSGECLCGAFAKKGELEELELWYPEAALRLKNLEGEILNKYPWRWGRRPPDWWMQEKKGQLPLFDREEFLCWSCTKNGDD